MLEILQTIYGIVIIIAICYITYLGIDIKDF